MNNFDNIIDNSNYRKSYKKSDWTINKNKERKEVYTLIDNTLLELISSEDNFKKYLNMQSKFDKYSVANVILIYAQMPEATQLKEYNKWKEAGAKNIKSGAINLLEPKEYTTSTGSVGISYEPKKVFDISKTDLPQQKKENKMDERLVLKSILYNSPIQARTVDSLENGKSAEWNQNDNTLSIVKGLGSPTIFYSITSELARYSFSELPDSSITNFKCNCVSYMICKKLGIDVSSYAIKIPNQLSKMENKVIRAELTSVRSVMEEINGRINQYFEELAKTNKNKEQER